jgi:hypothetical protein
MIVVVAYRREKESSDAPDDTANWASEYIANRSKQARHKNLRY